jgi:hypothetical protein
LPGVFSRRGKHASDPQTLWRNGLFPRGTIGDKPSYSVFFAADGSDNAFGRLPNEVGRPSRLFDGNFRVAPRAVYVERIL